MSIVPESGVTPHLTFAEIEQKINEINANPTEYYNPNVLKMSNDKTGEDPLTVEDVEAHFYDVVGGPKHVGKRFCLWALQEYQNRLPYMIATKPPMEDIIAFDDFLVTLIPKVDIKYKVYRLANFNNVESTFNTTVVVMLDWIDPSLCVVKEKGHEIDWEDHFWPQFEMQGFAGELMTDMPTPKYKNDRDAKYGSEYRASMTYKFSDQTAYSRLNFRQFPFDYQVLEYSMKLLSIRLPDVLKRKEGVRPRACNPTRWRVKEGGHEVLKEADCLADFSVLRLVGKAYSSQYGPFPELMKKENTDYPDYIKAKKKQQEKNKRIIQWKKFKQYKGEPVYFSDDENEEDADNFTLDEQCDTYTMQVVIHRESLNVLWNMCFSLFVIDCLVFTAHGIPIGDLADRLSVNLTLLLTAMAFKWVLNDGIPNVPYLTTMEIYVVLTFLMLFIQGMSFWLFADLFAYRCDISKDLSVISNQETASYTDYITGETKNLNNYTGVLLLSCSEIHAYDRVVMFVEVFFFIFKNISFAVKYYFHADSERLKNKTEFEDLSFAEFTSKNNFLWPGKKGKTKRGGLENVAIQNIGAAISRDNVQTNEKKKYFNADKDILLLAVKSNPKALMLIEESMKDDEEIVLEAVKKNGMALQYAHSIMKNNENVVLEAVKQNGLALQYATDRIKCIRAIVTAAVTQNGEALRYARSDDTKKTENVEQKHQ
jgi:hypothetical protein